MDYTEQLRAAHLVALKQQYLDAMEQARAELESNQKQHEKSARTAYVEKMTDLRDRPQQLRSLGLAGGVEDEDLRGILDEYRAKYEELKEWQREFVAEYKREMARQQRRMDAAVAEYNARIALEDYNASPKSTRSSGSSRSSRSSSRSYGASKGSSSSGTASGLSPAVQEAVEGREKGHIWSGSHGGSSSYYSGASGGGSGGGVR